MAPITASIEIKRSPEDVFAYLSDLARHVEWQTSLQDVKVQGDGPVSVGTRLVERRKVPGGAREMTLEITEHESPRRMGFRGVDGPIRAVGSVTISAEGEGSRLDLELDFEGHGLGKLLLPLVRSQARKEVPLDQQRLKERLEAGT